MPRPLDRRVALVALAGCAIVLAAVTGVSVSERPRSGPTTDPTAVAGFVDLLAHEPARWQVVYDLERRRPDGQVLHARVTELAFGATRLTSGLGTLEGVLDGQPVDCTTTPAGPQCLANPVAGGPVVDQARLVRALAASRRYAIVRAADDSVVGEPVRCFRLDLLWGPPVGPYGFGAEECLAHDGVPLRTRVERAGAVDTRRAVAVRRSLGPERVAALVAPFGLRPSPSGRSTAPPTTAPRRRAGTIGR